VLEDVYGNHAFIKAPMIRWARERLNLTIEQAAGKIPVKPDKWEAWEAGKALPTLGQARTLAQRLHVPFGLLYLSTPPTEELPLPDLRTPRDRPSGHPSPELTDLVNDIVWKQQWYRGYQQAEGVDPLPFIGKYPLDADRNQVADDIRRVLGIDDDMRREAKGADHFLRLLTRGAERAGVLVMRSGAVEGNTSRPLDKDEFQGFAISDQFAPLVFINGKDLKVVQVFTFLHEVAHLWFGQSGISNPDFRISAAQQERTIERACNIVAAEALVPRDDLIHHWNSNLDADANIGALGKRYWVSRIVLLRRANETKIISDAAYNHLYRIYSTSNRETEPKTKSSGGDFYATLPVRNSLRFTSTVLSSLAADRVSTMHAARLLNVKASTLDNVANHIYGRLVSA
jgi:Zn-dependent peptidase ImmA (M78 family)/DNA-binding XRE family transcriptional regulator